VSDSHQTRVCIDLFAGLGGFSAAFRDADAWEVTTVELREDLGPDVVADVLKLRPDDLLNAVGYEREEIDVLVILASPPCTYFSTGGITMRGTSIPTRRLVRVRERPSRSSIMHWG